MGTIVRRDSRWNNNRQRLESIVAPESLLIEMRDSKHLLRIARVALPSIFSNRRDA
jgi:hypothetical protein